MIRGKLLLVLAIGVVLLSACAAPSTLTEPAETPSLGPSETAQNQLPQLEEKVAETKAELKYISDALLKNKQELASQKECLEKYQSEVKAKVAQLEKELLAMMKQLEVAKNEVEEVAALKAELTKKGLDLQTVLEVAKAF